jgi:hypothetical protein
VTRYSKRSLYKSVYIYNSYRHVHGTINVKSDEYGKNCHRDLEEVAFSEMRYFEL